MGSPLLFAALRDFLSLSAMEVLMIPDQYSTSTISLSGRLTLSGNSSLAGPRC